MATPTPTAPPGKAAPSAERELTVISHSQLFYWWPVWLVGFLMALLTWAENDRLAVVPAGTRVTAKTEVIDGRTVPVGYLVEVDKDAGTTKPLDIGAMNTSNKEAAFPTRVSQHAGYGSVFIMILLITMVITNVPLRGLWSFLVIIMLVVMGLLFSVFNVWNTVFENIQSLRIYINLGGYVFIATSVFVIWAVSTWVFDRQVYMVVTPGQIRVREHIGDSTRTYDTVGITFEKKRDDLFRHYILGFGSGDLVIRTSGAERHEIYLSNVLGIGWKLPAIEEMIKERPTAV